MISEDWDTYPEPAYCLTFITNKQMFYQFQEENQNVFIYPKFYMF